jgi:hypothetical protein
VTFGILSSIVPTLVSTDGCDSGFGRRSVPSSCLFTTLTRYGSSSWGYTAGSRAARARGAQRRDGLLGLAARPTDPKARRTAVGRLSHRTCGAREFRTPMRVGILACLGFYGRVLVFV